MDKVKVIQVRVDEKLYKEIDRIVKDEGRTISSYVRYLLVKSVANDNEDARKNFNEMMRGGTPADIESFMKVLYKK